jgi:hypothetical protein
MFAFGTGAAMLISDLHGRCLIERLSQRPLAQLDLERIVPAGPGASATAAEARANSYDFRSRTLR